MKAYIGESVEEDVIEEIKEDVKRVYMGRTESNAGAPATQHASASSANSPAVFHEGYQSAIRATHSSIHPYQYAALAECRPWPPHQR